MMVFTASSSTSENTSGPYSWKYLARLRVRATAAGEVQTWPCGRGAWAGWRALNGLRRDYQVRRSRHDMRTDCTWRGESSWM